MIKQSRITEADKVLTAFQQVEDNLSALRILSLEIQQQDTAIQSATRNLSLATERYRLGIDPYLNVIAAQTGLLTNQETGVNLRMLTTNDLQRSAYRGSWAAGIGMLHNFLRAGNSLPRRL